jgi:Cu/Ag efflux protein CusF
MRVISECKTIFVIVITLGLIGSVGVAFEKSPFSQRRREQRYPLTGVIKSVDKSNRRATIKHDKVEGLMDAMTMPFLLKDEKALNEMQPGDRIKATLVSTDDGAQWLEKIVITVKSTQARDSNKPTNEKFMLSTQMSNQQRQGKNSG